MQDFTKKIVIVVRKDLPEWQILNTIAHSAAFIGNKLNSNFDTGDYFSTQDDIRYPRNAQYPIIILSAKHDQLVNLGKDARLSDILHIKFIKEMIETTDDQEIDEKLHHKLDKNIEYLGLGLFGEKNIINGLTKHLSLWK